MNQPVTDGIRRELTCPRLPLAVYREVAAHLRQVDHVQTGLIPHGDDPSAEFDYYQSQVAGLWLEYPEELTPQWKQQIEAILDFYAKRHGAWQPYQDSRPDSATSPVEA